MSAKSRRRGVGIGLILAVAFLATLAVFVLLSLWTDVLHEPADKIRVGSKIQNRYRLGPGTKAWFGTDASGYDGFARCIHFARNTLIVGLSSTVIGLTVGGLLGMLAGYFRGWVDRVISIFLDCMLAIPALVLAIMLVRRLDDLRASYSWLGWLSRRWELVIVLSLLSIAPLARIVRARTMALRESEFVTAARSLGANHVRVLWKEITPNLVATVLTVAFTGLGILIGAEGALAFLGVGLEGSWGAMIDSSRNDLSKGWWATVFPALMLLCTVMSVNVIGDWLARRFDIREAAI